MTISYLQLSERRIKYTSVLKCYTLQSHTINLFFSQEKLVRTDKKSDEYEARYQLAVRTITHLKNGIHSIFTRIGVYQIFSY